MTTVNVTVEFEVAEGADFEFEQESVLDELFNLESVSSSVSDAGQICDSSRRFVALSVYAHGPSVDEATAAALSVIIGAVSQAGSASWVWQATHVTPAEVVEDLEDPQLLSA